MFHISDVKKYNRCKRLFMLEYNQEHKPFDSFVRFDENEPNYAKLRLGIDDCFQGETGDDASLALDALHSHEWLVQARFEYNNLRIKAPYLHKVEGGYDLIYHFVGLYPKYGDLLYYAAVVYVLEHLNIPIRNISVLHLNAKYRREEEIDVNELYILSDYFYNDRKNPTMPMKETIYQNMPDFDTILQEMQECIERNELVEAERLPRCASRNKCSYYYDCFKEEAEMEDDSVLTLMASRYRYDMESEGIKYLKDVDIDRIEGTRCQFAQIRASQNGGLFVDRLALKTWLKNFKFPLAFVDFEWECFAIPPYKGMRPYDVLPFEYSLHIMQEDGSVEHKTFISIHDDRRDFAESLIASIPKEGSVVAYNAFGAEKRRMDELGVYFKDLQKDLQQITKRLIDLQLPFELGIVYDTRMRGYYSLKQLMSMLDGEGYGGLDIQQGMEAVFEWRHLDMEDDLVDSDKIIQELNEYCSMDTYAMIVVYKWLIKIAN